MDKNCRNCKWFDCGNCNNGDLGVTLDTYDEAISRVEDGHIGDMLSDKIGDIKLAIAQCLIDKEYIKKTAIKKVREDEDIEIDYKEIIDDTIHEAIDLVFSNIEPQATISNPESFYCCKWE